MFEDIGKAIGCLGVLAIVGVGGLLFCLAFIGYGKTGEQVYESKTRVRPDYRLEAKGKKVDTIYIYTFK